LVGVRSAGKEWLALKTKYWYGMQHVWYDLYYCFRDDIVFPGSDPSRFVPANEMVQLLHEDSRR
jgi:hypothetical protein